MKSIYFELNSDEVALIINSILHRLEKKRLKSATIIIESSVENKYSVAIIYQGYKLTRDRLLTEIRSLPARN